MTAIDTTTDLLGTVERIRPILEEFNPRAEAERRVAPEAYTAMVDAGLFKMAMPRAYGGLELHPVELLTIWEAVARIDSAAAWNLVMNQSIANFAAWLPDEGARELMGSGAATVAGALFPPGSARPVDGGWLISACVPIASGCQNADWLAVPAIVVDGDRQRLDPETGQPVSVGGVLPARGRDDPRYLAHSGYARHRLRRH